MGGTQGSEADIMLLLTLRRLSVKGLRAQRQCLSRPRERCSDLLKDAIILPMLTTDSNSSDATTHPWVWPSLPGRDYQTLSPPSNRGFE